MPPVGAAIGTALAAFGGALTYAGLAVGGAMGLADAASFAVMGVLQRLAGGVALSALSRALAPKPGGVRFGGAKLRAEVGEDRPASIILGLRGTAGDLVYRNSYGNPDEPNAFYTQVFELADFPVRALKRVMINGEWATLSASADTSVWKRGYPVIEYRKNGRDFLWVRFHDGRQVSADPGLREAFGDDEDWPWLADRIGRGIPYVIVTARSNPEVHRAAPTCLFEVEGAALYDPRRDSTRPGGSGPQRRATPSTWGGDGDFNPAVQAYNILLGLLDPVTGGWIWGGREISQRDLPEAAWFAAMNKCDAPAHGRDGVEPAWRTGIEIPFDEATTPADALLEIGLGCMGQFAEYAGGWIMTVGAPGAPVYAFTDDDIILTAAEEFDPFPGIDQAYNSVTATYPSPEHGWQTREAPRRASATYLAEDGRPLNAELALAAVPYEAQAQRAQLAGLKAGRRFRQQALVLPPELAALSVLDVVAQTSARNGFVDKDWELDGLEDLPDGCVAVRLREVDPTDYDFGAGDLLDGGGGFLGRPPAQVWSDDFSVAPGYLIDAASNQRRAAIDLSWNPAKDATGVRWQMRLAADHTHVPSQGGVDLGEEEAAAGLGLEVYDGEALEVWADEPLLRGYAADIAEGHRLISDGVIPLVAYQLRVRYVRGRRRGPWCDWMEVTAPSVLLSELDLDASLNNRIDTAVDGAEASREDSAAALAISLANQEAVAALAGDTISDLEALIATLGGIDAGDVLAARELALAALERGWNTDPTFQLFTAGAPDHWTATGLATYGAPFVGRYGGGLAIDIPTGAYAASLRSASDVAEQMTGADRAAAHVVIYGMVTLTAGDPASLHLRAEWKAAGSGSWTRGDMKGLTAPDGTFVQLGITVQPGIRQGFEVLVRRPAGMGAADAISVLLGKVSGITTAVDLDIHLLGIRAATEQEIVGAASAASIVTQGASIAGLTASLATLSTTLTSSIAGVYSHLGLTYLTEAEINAALALFELDLLSTVDGVVAEAGLRFYTKAEVDEGIADAIAAFAITLSLTTVEGLSAALTDEAALRIDGDNLLGGRIAKIELRRDPASIVTNGGFASGTNAAWTATGAVWPAAWTVVARGGAAPQSTAPAPFMARLPTGGGAVQAVNQAVEAAAGDRFSASFFYAAAGASRNVTLLGYVRALDLNGGSLGTFPMGQITGYAGTSWQKAEAHGLGPMPAGTASARFELRRLAGGSGDALVTQIAGYREDSGAAAGIAEVGAVAVGANAAIASLSGAINASFGSQSAFISDTRSAVASLDLLASTWVFRQKAGAAVGTAEAVAFEQPDGTAISTFKLTYDYIDLDSKVSARDFIVHDSTNKVPDDQLQSARSWGITAGTTEWACYPDAALSNAGSLGELRWIGTPGAAGNAILVGLPFPVNTSPDPDDAETETLACSYRMRGNGAAYVGYAQLAFFDSAGAQIALASIDYQAAPVTTTATIRRKAVIEVPALAVTACWRFVVARASTASAFARFFRPVARRQSSVVEIKDGAITAAKANISDLGALVATLGTCTITSALNFAPGVVVTGALGLNAVSDIGASVRDSALVIAADDSWTTVCSYTVALVPGTAVLLSTRVELDRVSKWNTGWSGLYIDAEHEYRLLRGSTVVHAGTRETFVDIPATGTGSRTYTLQMRTSEPGSERLTLDYFNYDTGSFQVVTAVPTTRRQSARVAYAHLVVQAFKR